MHEFSLMADLLRKIEATAREAQATQVQQVCVRIGALAHISASHFREHFEHGTQGTLAEGAKLDIEMCEDVQHPQAQDIVLQSIEVG